MDLTATAAATIERQCLIPHGASVLVAVSGGLDSTALLHFLNRAGYNVEAAHLNHQFRGTESDGDADFVKELCRWLSIKLTSASVDVPRLKADQKTSAQQAARKARYEFLETVRQDRGLDLIATAHNLEDRIETVLLNIVRGTGVDGLRGVPYRRGAIIRPFLDSSRYAIEAYLEVNALTARTDSSNIHPKYARNNVRSELIPYLERRYNASVKQSILRLSEIASDESEYLNSIATAWIRGRKVLPISEIKAEQVGLQRRILRQWLRTQTDSELSDISHQLIEQFRQQMGGPFAITLPGGSNVVESDGYNAVMRRLDCTFVDESMEAPIVLGMPSAFGRYLVTVRSAGSQVDRETLHVRQWRNGDRITLNGGTRKVQDIFTDSKVPRDQRRQYPLIEDKHGLVSVGDIRYAARANGTMVTVVKAD